LKELLFFMIKNLLHIGLLLLLTFPACKKQNLKNAEKSLQGSWAVEAINSSYGIKTDLGTQTNQEFNEEGELGQFFFEDKTVEYRFTRLDTLYENQTSWELVREKVNAGFTNAERYTLTIDDFDFICAFGDQTSDAEKEATEISLFFETEDIGNYYAFELQIKKVK